MLYCKLAVTQTMGSGSAELYDAVSLTTCLDYTHYTGCLCDVLIKFPKNTHGCHFCDALNAVLHDFQVDKNAISRGTKA